MVCATLDVITRRESYRLVPILDDLCRRALQVRGYSEKASEQEKRQSIEAWGYVDTDPRYQQPLSDFEENNQTFMYSAKRQVNQEEVLYLSGGISRSGDITYESYFLSREYGENIDQFYLMMIERFVDLCASDEAILMGGSRSCEDHDWELFYRENYRELVDFPPDVLAFHQDYAKEALSEASINKMKYAGDSEPYPWILDMPRFDVGKAVIFTTYEAELKALLG